MSSSPPLGPGTAISDDPFWLETIKHQGISAFNANPSSYQVFRNVKDFGAKGDGIIDDTAAINAAISSGGRCGGGSCGSSTVSPAIVYFPAGIYVVSSPVILYYYTQMIGDARRPPTLLATSNFQGIAVIDANPYRPGGMNWYTNQNNFFRSVRNIVIDLRKMPDLVSATGLHWQVAQATSLINVVVNMSTAPGNNHQGIFMENGSGGFMGDLIFNGGKFGIWVGNQQFTVRNITINNAATAIYGHWNWGWTFQGVTINNCQVGFDLTTGGSTAATQGYEAESIIDAVVTNTPIFIRTSRPSNGVLAGSLVLSNVTLKNVLTAVGVIGGAVVLVGGTRTIDAWGQGNVYAGTSGEGTFTQGAIPAPIKAASLLDSAGNIVSKGHPQYESYAASQFVSARDKGCVGDGRTDDTAAIHALFDKYAGSKIIFFDAGTYLVTDTITIPAGTRIVGEAWSNIMGSGSKFSDPTNPTVIVRVGDPGSSGVLEITDMVFKTRGPAGGAIVVEWNVHDPPGQQAASGMWDSHIVLGGTAGTNLELSKCPAGSNSNCCMAAFLALHLTSESSAYLEGTWIWLADHDLDGDGASQITIFSGRGVLSQSAGPVWLIGTASEHHTLYQYNLVDAKNHWIGFAQTEAPYYQPSPAPPTPFSINSGYSDPSFTSDSPMAWAVNVASSTNIVIFGSGFYCFFNNYSQDHLPDNTCQNQIINIDSESHLQIYNLSTVGTTYQLSVSSTGVIKSSDSPNGFAETLTVWTSMAETAHPWPAYIHQSFKSAILRDPSGKDESVFYAPFTRLLYTLFSVEGQYEVVPQFKSVVRQSGQGGINIVTVLVVEVNRHPVLFMEIKPPAAIPHDSKREEADWQMRHRFRDLRQDLSIYTLHGISAFGTRLSFYEYDPVTHALRPEVIQSDPAYFADVAPISRWDCDVLQQEGADRLKGVVEKVKEMCAQV